MPVRNGNSMSATRFYKLSKSSSEIFSSNTWLHEHQLHIISVQIANDCTKSTTDYTEEHFPILHTQYIKVQFQATNK